MKDTNEALFHRAQQVMPGGVSSPVRAFRSVGGTPRFFVSGSGSRIVDVEGKEYIDFVGSWGPLILGHAHPAVVSAICNAAAKGTSFGAPTPSETRLAEMIIAVVPSIEKIRFVNSGTEATMSALRLARGFTGRKLIVKFNGCYHGHADSLLIQAGSGATTLGIPDSAGIPAELTHLTIPAEFNDSDAIIDIFRTRGRDIAAVIVEPVAGNMGVIPPRPGFLETLRRLCSEYDALLIFDEVMTGFRVARGCAQKLYGITPDLTCFGKVIGGGLPVGAYGGRREIMSMVSPEGPVYQAGTLSGNPIAIAAGLATFSLISEPGFYRELENKCSRFESLLDEELKRNKLPARLQRVGSMATLFFCDKPVWNYTEAKTADIKAFNKLFHFLLDNGFSMPPSQFEAFFISAAHGDDDLAALSKAIGSFGHLL